MTYSFFGLLNPGRSCTVGGAASSCEADWIASALRHLRLSFEAHGLRVTEVRLEEVPRGD